MCSEICTISTKVFCGAPEMVLKRVFAMFVVLSSFALYLTCADAMAQENSQFSHWLELQAADQSFSNRSDEIGRTQAFLEFLGDESVVFREGPVDAQQLYSSEAFQANATELVWKAHYIDVSRDGDLGLSAGPYAFTGLDGAQEVRRYGYLVSVWKKNQNRWQLQADIAVAIPGVLSLDVEADYAYVAAVQEESAHPVMARADTNSMQSLIDADNLFGRSINFRGGQRALLRYGLENSRVYLPGMAPAVGAEAASTVYGAFLDNQLDTTNPVSLDYRGGYLSTSKEMGFTYGSMATNTQGPETGFRTNYLRLWRLTQSNEWKIAVEVLDPY